MRTTILTSIILATLPSVCDAQESHSASADSALTKQTWQLKGLEVRGYKRLTRITPSGIVYDLSKDKNVQTQDLLTALGRVPLVTVDAQQNLKVKGSGNFSIYLNGKPYRVAQLNPQEVLRSIPASTIAKVEVITTLDGRYSSEDGDAVINIITVKKRLDGYTLSLNGGGATQPKAKGGATLIATKGKVEMNVGYNYDMTGQDDQPIASEYDYPAIGRTVRMDSHVSRGRWESHTLRAMLNWTVDSLNTLYADAHGLLKHTNSRTTWNQTVREKKQNPVSSLFQNENQNWAGTVETNLIFRNYFRNRKNTERISAGYRYTYTPDVRDFSQWYVSDESSRSKRKTKGGMDEHTVSADWLIPLAALHQLRVGGRQVFRLGDSRSSLYHIDNGTESPSTEKFGNDMRYHQNISALYASYNGSVGIFALSAGLRWEYTYLSMLFPQAEALGFSRRQCEWLPSASVSYQPSRFSQLSLSYRKSVQRPGILQLNPFEELYSDYSGAEGNPSLLYADTHNLGLDYSLSLTGFFLSAGISYKYTANAVAGYDYYNDQKRLINTFGNIHHTTQWGGNLYVSYRPWCFLSLMVAGDIGSYQMRDQKLGVDQNALVYNLTCFGDFYLPHNWSVGGQYGTYKNAPDIWGKRKAFPLYSLYVGKSFLKSALNVRAVINSPFHKYFSIYESTRRDGYSFFQDNSAIARSFELSVSYTLSGGKTKNLQRDRSLQNDDQQTGVK